MYSPSMPPLVDFPSGSPPFIPPPGGGAPNFFAAFPGAQESQQSVQAACRLSEPTDIVADNRHGHPSPRAPQLLIHIIHPHGRYLEDSLFKIGLIPARVEPPRSGLHRQRQSGGRLQRQLGHQPKRNQRLQRRHQWDGLTRMSHPTQPGVMHLHRRTLQRAV